MTLAWPLVLKLELLLLRLDVRGESPEMGLESKALKSPKPSLTLPQYRFLLPDGEFVKESVPADRKGLSLPSCGAKLSRASGFEVSVSGLVLDLLLREELPAPRLTSSRPLRLEDPPAELLDLSRRLPDGGSRVPLFDLDDLDREELSSEAFEGTFRRLFFPGCVLSFSKFSF